MSIQRGLDRRSSEARRFPVARQAGKFVWFEHLSSDPGRAQRFHGEVFGDRAETGLGGLGGAARWVGYISVDDVDAKVRAVVAAGGRLLSPSVHDPAVGRRARVADGQGTVFGVVTLDGPDPAGGPFAWNELWTPDPTAALAFYATAFGYYASAVGTVGTYHLLQLGGAPRAGILKAPLSRPGWLPYLRVDVCDDAAARAARHGGTIEIEPTDIPRVGRIAIFRDPLGARLAALEPLSDRGDAQVASGEPASLAPPSTGRASAAAAASAAGRASGVPPSSSPQAANINAKNARVSRFMRP